MAVEPGTSRPELALEKPAIWIEKTHRKERAGLEFELPFGSRNKKEM